MRDYVITADSNCDLLDDYIKEKRSELFPIIMIWMALPMVMRLILLPKIFIIR